MKDQGNLPKRFGGRVRELRKRAGFSQEAFADHCGLDRTYIGGVERGERNISLRNIGIIALSLGVPLSTLMQGLDTDNGHSSE